MPSQEPHTEPSTVSSLHSWSLYPPANSVQGYCQPEGFEGYMMHVMWLCHIAELLEGVFEKYDSACYGQIQCYVTLLQPPE